MNIPHKVSVLGIGVSRTTYEETVRLIIQAGKEKKSLTVSAVAVHGLMLGVLNHDFGNKLNQLDILTPDGQPVRWALNLFSSKKLKERVYGPTLMLKVCEIADRGKIGVYLFGSTNIVLDRLKRNMKGMFNDLLIVGSQADRFREATPEEDIEDIKRITDSGAGIVFCGRGCPRQEEWCYNHRNKLNVAMIAVGAAFDFHAGTLQQAPLWIQNAGFEWLFRLLKEPTRLWRRYILLNPLFIICILLQLFGIYKLSKIKGTNNK